MKRVAMIVTVAFTLVTLPSPGVSAGSVMAPRAARHGDCTGVSTWQLRVITLATSELRVRFLVIGGEEGQTWNVYLDRDGVGFFAGSRDSGIGGLVRVRQRIPDLPGEEVIRAAGHNVVTGEVCRGRVKARTVP
jgi:hypothetical protein